MKIKVLLSIPNLEGYGVQHDVRTLMRYWDKEKFDVMMLLNSRTGDFAEQFSSEMKSIEVDNYILQIPKLRVLTRIDAYRRVLNKVKPDVVISFVPFCNYATMWAKIAGTHKFGLAVSEHAHVSAAMKDKENMNNFFMRLYRYTFSKFYNSKFVDVVKCIAEESRQDLIKNHGIKEEKTVLIHNPVPIEEIREVSKKNVNHPWFNGDEKNIPVLINVGRISYQKRQDILIKAFTEVRKKINCRLMIVGGGDQTELKKLAGELGVLNHIYFAGFQKNPWKWIAKANLFVLSSIWEGLPCVLTESMAVGTPIVSTRCQSGPTEMLLNGAAGYLCEVEDIFDLRDKIVQALEEKEETIIKVETATKNLFRFKPENVVKQYENLAVKLAAVSKENNKE